MAANEVSLVLKVSAAGLKDIVDQSSQFSKNMQSGASAGGTTGSRKLAAMAENNSYNLARSTGSGSTGSSSSDFAAQARGLGGLVHLYATFAANLFAVSTAFNALSKAMDTSNLIQGLDQLGAVSGKNLGSIAQQMTKVTDGALSLQDAMKSTALASSAGMSNKDMLRMTEVAKKASIALGRDMADSMDRLTKGIAKTQPELLDELGIMTRVIPAQQEYAKSIGKTASSLTDFEKKQAFANSVLAEGERKFKDIKIETNPYSQLLASIKNVAQSGLELVNTVLTPLISMLAKNPTALVGALTLVGVSLFKQAIPALSAWREGLNKAAAEAAFNAKKIHDSFEEFDIARKLEIGGKVAKQATAEANAAVAGVQTALGNAFTGKSSLLSAAMSGSYDAGANQKKIDAQVNANTTILSNLKAQRDLIDQTDKVHLAAMDADIAKQEVKLGQLKQAAMYNRVAATQQEAAAAAMNTAEAQAAMDPTTGSGAWQRKQLADRAAKSARMSAIMANVGSNTETMGVRGALSNLHDDIQKGTKIYDESGAKVGLLTDKLGFLGKTSAYIGGTVRIMGSAIATAFNAFLPYIGLAIAAFELISLKFSKNGEEVSTYNEKLNALSSDIKLATEVNKLYGDSLSISSVIARSNALDGLSTSVDSLTSSLEAADAKASDFDKFFDNFKSIIGTDLKSTFASKMGDSIHAALDVISDPALKKEAEDRLKLLLEVSSLDSKSLTDAFNKADPAKVISMGKAASAALQIIKDKATPAASALTDIRDGFKDLELKFTDLSNTLINNDPLSKFGASLASQTIKLSNAFSDPIQSVATLNAILKDTSLIKMFPPEAQANIIAAASQINTVYKEIEDAKQAVYDAQRKVDEVSKGIENTATAPAVKEILVRVKIEGEAQLAAATTRLDTASTSMQKIQSDLTAAVSSSIKTSIALITQPIADAVARGAIDVQKSLLDKLPKTPAGAELASKLNQQALVLQANQLTATNNLIKELELSRLSAERLSIENKKSGLDLTKKQDQEKLTEYNSQISDIKKVEKALTDKNLGKNVKAGEYGKLNEIPPEILKVLQQESGLRTKLAEIDSKKEIERITGLINKVDAAFDIAKQGMESTISTLEKSKADLISSPAYLQLPAADQRSKVDELDMQIQAYTKGLSLLPALKDINIADVVSKQAGKNTQLGAVAKEDIGIGVAKIGDLTKQADLTKSAADNAKEQSRAIEDINKNTAKANSLDIKNNIINTKGLDIVNDRTQSAIDALEVENNRGRLTVDDYNKRKQGLSLTLIENDRQKQLNAAELAHNQAIRGYEVAKKTGTGDQQAQAALDIENENAQYKNLTESIDRSTEAKRTAAKVTTQQTHAEMVLEDAINSSADSLAGAFFDATQSGKFDFTDMINSMLLDLAKLEFKMSMMDLYKTAGGAKGIMGAIGSLFGQANGGAWVNGVQAFAKGGTFTNSVVDSPTVFKFAKGTGIMGEAGPEAIMPLKRDNNGRLGVANHDGGSSNPTQVVVNNYSGQPAEAKESIDSRGQRKVEVTIGNMVAGEIMRSGSAAQQSIKNTFGRQPQLIRR